MSLVDLLDHIASQIYLSPDDSLHLGVDVLAGLVSNVGLVIALFDIYAYTHEVSVSDGPRSPSSHGAP